MSAAQQLVALMKGLAWLPLELLARALAEARVRVRVRSHFFLSEVTLRGLRLAQR